jgi:hypothetical protein
MLWTGKASEWKLMDVQGRIVAQFSLPKERFVQLNLTDICSSGIYILKSNDDEVKIVVE